ncbi:SIR2 family protein [Terracoccus sp. 273MFTsu3.1]|uniref:SIR2 family protein n=1 Tax=Terracoccus sp. 273MFTsu3.1 TaxID=1172188 RepID=UPI0003A923E7|nr:SIR2 family protein [Terracoccus sp. 273MFTsu3.1]
MDTLLGQLDEDPEIAVHDLARLLVNAPDSRPNANHQALVRLAARGVPRIVTTNYDLHLSTVADSLGLHLETHRAPALPLGHDFRGLVYLHGAADGPSDRLVVTDRDFGHAYLRQAWATRFLSELFSNYTVLFVGYSHGDLVMRYLGLALGRDTARYVLTHQPQDPMWARLGINPVGYPVEDDDHSALTECLAAWADLAEMGLLDHRQRIRSLLETAAELSPPEQSYLEASIRRQDRVDFFCSGAERLKWLSWAATQHVFQALFSADQPHDEVLRRLARWFANNYAVSTTEHSDAAWNTLTGAGGEVSLTLWHALAQALSSAQDGSRPAHHRRWLRLLMWQDRPECQVDFLEYALMDTDPDNDPEIALELFEHLIEPRLLPKRGYGLFGPTLEAATRGSEHWLTEGWNKVISQMLPDRATDILALAEASIRKHYTFENVIAGRTLDRFAFRRSAIQPHAQDQYREPFDAVIDAARDSIVSMASDRPEEAARVLQRWSASRQALYKRLALHAYTVSDLLTPDQKLGLVVADDLLLDREVAQELYELVGSAAPQAGREAIDSLVLALPLAGPDDVTRYACFQLLAWLHKHGASSDRLTAAIAQMQEVDPTLTPEEHPGFRSWMEVGWHESAPPMTTEGFHAKVLDDPKAATAYLQTFEPSAYPRQDLPSLDDALSMLADTIRMHPRDGLALWRHVQEAPELRDTIIRAWTFVEDPDDQVQVINLLLDLDLRLHLNAMTQFFMNANRDAPERWVGTPHTEELLWTTWEATAANSDDDRTGDWVSRVINSPAGCLIDFWFQTFYQAWAKERENWTGLREDHRAFLDMILSGTSPQRLPALTQIAGRIHHLYDVDPQWCRSALLPLSNWDTDPRTAAAFWWGVLSFGRWNLELLDDGLLDGLLSTIARLDEFGNDQRQRWAGMLASVALTADPTAEPVWVNRLTAAASSEQRTAWLQSISEQFRELPLEARGQAWRIWIRDYWTQRNRADPMVLTAGEASELAECVPWLPAAQLEEAVALTVRSPARLNAHADLLAELPDDFLKQPPEVLSTFLTALMERTVEPFYGDYYLRPLLFNLVKREGNWDTLREAALRLGILLD